MNANTRVSIAYLLNPVQASTSSGQAIKQEEDWSGYSRSDLSNTDDGSDIQTTVKTEESSPELKSIPWPWPVYPRPVIPSTAWRPQANKIESIDCTHEYDWGMGILTNPQVAATCSSTCRGVTHLGSIFESPYCEAEATDYHQAIPLGEDERLPQSEWESTNVRVIDPSGTQWKCRGCDKVAITNPKLTKAQWIRARREWSAAYVRNVHETPDKKHWAEFEAAERSYGGTQ